MEDKTAFIAHVQSILSKNNVPAWIVYGERVMENLLAFGFVEDGRCGFSNRRLFLQLCMLVACNLNERLNQGDKNLKKGRYPMRGVFSRFRISDTDIDRYWGISKIVVVVDPKIPAVIEVRERNSQGTSVGIQLGDFQRYLERIHCEEEYLAKQTIFVSTCLNEVA